VSQNEVKSQIANLSSQLNNLNNQLASQKTRNLELEIIITQLQADIAVGSEQSTERDKSYSQNLENFQQQMKELQLQLEQQVEMTEAQREEIKRLKESTSSLETTTTTAAPMEHLSGPPLNRIIEKQVSQGSPAPADSVQATPTELFIAPTSSDPPAAVSLDSANELLELQKKYEELEAQLPLAVANEEKFNELKSTTKNEIKKWMKEFEKANGAHFSSSLSVSSPLSPHLPLPLSASLRSSTK
jgi:hypothetical protein